jgi:hypothetical protein
LAHAGWHFSWDWLLQQSAACASPVTERVLLISVHQPPGAMIDKIRGSAELEESTALEPWRTRPKTDCYKYFVIILLSLLEKKLHVNP